MAKADLKDMDVDALLELRADVERVLAERSRDLERQLALLSEGRGSAGGKRRGRPQGATGRTSVMKGVKIAPKYRGPGGETWAGRGATPRWLAALLKEGHSIEEFSIGKKRGKRAGVTASKTAKKRKAAPTKRGRKAPAATETSEAAA